MQFLLLNQEDTRIQADIRFMHKSCDVVDTNNLKSGCWKQDSSVARYSQFKYPDTETKGKPVMRYFSNNYNVKTCLKEMRSP